MVNVSVPCVSWIIQYIPGVGDVLVEIVVRIDSDLPVAARLAVVEVFEVVVVGQEHGLREYLQFLIMVNLQGVRLSICTLTPNLSLAWVVSRDDSFNWSIVVGFLLTFLQ